CWAMRTRPGPSGCPAAWYSKHWLLKIMSMGVDYGPGGAPTQRLILASGSPQRWELLGRIDSSFHVAVPDSDEGSISTPGDLVDTARGKMLAVRAEEPQALIVAADTGVFLGGRHLGKPSGPEEARKYLRALSGRWHSVFTGLCVSLPGCVREELVETGVRFRSLSEEELDWYIAGEYVLDKAGAYAVQGRAAVFVERIEGEYTNVVGLPMATLYGLLQELGWGPGQYG
ncbi:MAG: Maf family protein, partial [Candidatus Bipolaricaulota bacterium]